MFRTALALLVLTASAGAQSATPASAITVPSGFKVELLKSATEREGSWVSMAIDDKGRLYISPQGMAPDGGIMRVTLSAAGQVEKVDWLPTKVGAAMGMLWAFDSLYVSGQGPDGQAIYRLRDTDGDDTLDEVKLIKKVPGGGGEHGAHAMVVGPDQKLYLTHGNSTPLVEGIAADSPYRHYAEDDLLPRIKDPVATFFDTLKVPYGHILRTDAEGKQWELFAGGLRNAYDIDFNADGELFTFDSDMEWDVGLPWYRPTRVLHVTSGAEFGFREGTAKWPAYYPDSLPGVVDIGLGSPTGVKFGTRSNFPAKYQSAFFAMDWTYGRILAVHMHAKGASYTAANPGASAFHLQGPSARPDVEVFLQGKGLPVSDLEFGKDGAMYFIVGGRGTQAGLYRVSWAGEDLSNEWDRGMGKHLEGTPPESAKRFRTIRHRTEELPEGVRGIVALWEEVGWGLESDDRAIRFAGRTALERLPVEQWRDKALGTKEPRFGLTMLLALARVGTKDDPAAILKALAKWPLDSLDDELKLLKLRVIQLCFIRHGRPSEELAALAIEKLGKQFPAPTFPLNRELSQLLVWLGAPDVVEKTLALLASAKDPAEQVWYANVLREATAWTPEQREEFFAWFAKAAEFQGGNSAQKFIGRIREIALSKAPEADRDRLLALSLPKPAPEKPAPAPRAVVQNWTLTDLAGELEKVGSGRDFARGKAAFTAAQCAACHLFAGSGGTNGPDLTAAASRYQRRDLLEAILDPNKGISEQYAVFHVTQFDGKKEAAGMIVEENNDFLKVLVDPLGGRTEMIGKFKLPKRELLPISPMPPGLLSTLTKEEILDLLAYIESGGKADAPMFRR